jgi:hypothetical protein
MTPNEKFLLDTLKIILNLKTDEAIKRVAAGAIKKVERSERNGRTENNVQEDNEIVYHP